MLQIAIRTCSAALFLLLMPALVWLSGWAWTPGMSDLILRPFYAITETVSAPWGLLTNIVLCLWFLWCLRYRIKPAIVLVVLLSAAVLTGQGVKSYVKRQVQEPRPYVQWLGKTQSMDVTAFYEQKKKARSLQVKNEVQGNAQIPDWLGKSWQADTGFSFPSGHTMFAASWALLGVGLLWPRRHYKTAAALLVWASLVMGSRLLLGMHWPRDLMASVGISWVLVTLACWLAQRLCGPFAPPPEEQEEIQSREPE
ncbi:phosphatidylglycerophosphatase B [Rouxiella silvae]|uniref:undecaprenyl-diphosphate phosphatase n=1 Tax=Rouxiella silvae TaxID=1646373 RepID=A0ABX3TYU7_9GAMM|nr:phosphatidylglycerophosphatase B [Rouxiella silvae]ORJ20350.1 phosphatidylglycerophosphatase B [Rouxiella silvae]